MMYWGLAKIGTYNRKKFHKLADLFVEKCLQ